MSKRSKSKRFYQQSADSIKQHAERFPFYSTLEEAENRNKNDEQYQQVGGNE